MTQATKLPLFIIVLTLSNLALLAPVKAVDPTDTFYGNGAGNGTTTGIEDSAFGYNALHDVSTGSYNTASGAYALLHNTNGSSNTASGRSALYFNTTGYNNTASGFDALVFNTDGSGNTASGSQALFSNTTGNTNTASGGEALYFNTTGNNNTASGYIALYLNATGNNNTASGYQALLANTTGNNNTASGNSALYFNTTGSNNIGLGFGGGGNLTTGNNNIDIGNLGVAGEGDTTRIGTGQTRCFVAGIYARKPSFATTLPVVIDSSGQLGTNPSSQQFKHDIKPMDTVSEAILSLKPVTFHYKGDQTNTAQFGLIAEEVEKVNPDLVVRDEDAKPYTVRYDAVDAMLLNEFLKEHRQVEELKASNADLRSTVARQEKQLYELATAVQKVSEQLRFNKNALRVVENN